MSDERELDAAETAAVRRLLADARVTEPTPPDVVARLDAALAAEQHSGDDAVADLDARRRRRRGRLLLAAAVVVIAAAGGGVVLDRYSPTVGDSAGESAGDSAADAEVPPPAATDDDTGDLTAPDAEDESGNDLPGTLEQEAGPLGALPQVRTGRTLTDDVNAALRRPNARTTRPRCAPPDAGGDVVTVSFDDVPAELVAEPPAAGLRTVTVWSCRSADDLPERTLRLAVD